MNLPPGQPESTEIPEKYLRASLLVEVPGLGMLAAKDTYPPWLFDNRPNIALYAIVNDLKGKIQRQMEEKGRK